MSGAVNDSHVRRRAGMKIRWLRVVLGALLLEIVLFAVLVPISFLNATLFLIAVPIGVFAFGYLVTRWLLKKLSTRLVLHGAFIGMVATVMYLGLVLAQPGGIAAAVAVVADASQAHNVIWARTNLGVDTGQRELRGRVINIQLTRADENLRLDLHAVEINFDAKARIRKACIQTVRVEGDR